MTGELYMETSYIIFRGIFQTFCYGYAWVVSPLFFVNDLLEATPIFERKKWYLFRQVCSWEFLSNDMTTSPWLQLQVSPNI